MTTVALQTLKHGVYTLIRVQLGVTVVLLDYFKPGGGGEAPYKYPLE